MSSLFRSEVVENRATRLHGEVVLTQSLSTSVMVGAVVLIVSIAAIWVTKGSYARMETAPGILVTSQPSAKVMAPVPGIVSNLRVSEGSIVSKGDRIAVINLDRSAVSGGGFAGEGLAAIEARLGLGDEQIELAARKAANDGVKLREAIASAERQAASLARQIGLQGQIVTSNRALFEQIATVVDRGFVSKVEFERRRQTLLNAEQALGQLEQQLIARNAEAAQARAQLAGLAVETARQKSDIKSSIQALAQQQAQLKGEQAYVVTAPISGRVTALQTGEGRTANNQRPLMTIVPQEAVLRAEVYAPSRAIGFVRPGQETRLLFDAFPYQRFGSFEGSIESVSRTVLDPRESDVPLKLEEAVYKVTVVLRRQNVEAFGERVPLQPGMTLTANIVLDRQSFLDWLLKPLNAIMKRTT